MPRFFYSRRNACQAPEQSTAVDIQNIVVRYPGSDTPSLDSVSLSIPYGTRIALVGHNGAGKSTLLKTLVGLAKIKQGSISVLGSPVGACSYRVAYLPQRGELDWQFPMNVLRLVVTGRYPHLGWLQNPHAEDYQLAQDALDRLGLSKLENRQIGELSGGQQQRVLFARAIAQQPELLLLDEPFNAVDAETRDIMTQVINALKDEGCTIVASTHHLQDLSSRFDGAFYLVDGRVIETPEGEFAGIVSER